MLQNCRSLNEMEQNRRRVGRCFINDKKGNIFSMIVQRKVSKGRRSLCYDRDAWNARKNLISDSVIDMVPPVNGH